MSKIDVPSEISGSVWKILASVGDEVTEGDVLLIMESMKMEIPLTAPEDGVVEAIQVAEGDNIKEGDVAVVLDA
jgi:acetyl-CoA carboxylase biotin carboxyl carrier protein